MKGSMRQRSSGSWELKFELGTDPSTGKRRSRTVTVRGTKRDAQIELRKLLGQVDAGIEADARRLTVATYLEQWLAGHLPTVSALTGERYERLIRLHIVPRIGHLALAKLSPHQLNQFYALLASAGRLDGKGPLRAQMIVHIDRLLHAALRDAVRARLIGFNPVDDAKAPKVERRKRDPLSDDEYQRLLGIAEGTRLEAPLLVLLGTGVRRGELLALTWRHVDFEAGVLRVVAAIEETRAHGRRIKGPKTEAGRRQIDLPGFVTSALVSHKRQQQEEHLAFGRGWTVDTLVFGDPITGGIWSPGGFSKAITRLARRAGVRLTPHGARHEHFSRLLALGTHPKVAQARAGHGSVAVTLDLYSHLVPGLQREAADKLGNAFATLREQSGGKAVASGPVGSDGKIVKL